MQSDNSWRLMNMKTICVPEYTYSALYDCVCVFRRKNDKDTKVLMSLYLSNGEL